MRKSYHSPGVVVKRFRDRIQAIRERRALKSFVGQPYVVQYRRYYVRRRYGHIMMERVVGRTLWHITRRYGPFDQEKTIALALEILKGVQVIHDRGYVHADLHSSNIIVTDLKTPAIKIIDLQHAARKNSRGVARAYRRLSRPPLKLAPETRRRFIRDSYDIYSVGYMCSMMMRGRHAGRRSLIVPRRRSDAEIWNVIKKATHRNPSERYQSAHEMIEALEAIRSTQHDPSTGHGVT